MTHRERQVALIARIEILERRAQALEHSPDAAVKLEATELVDKLRTARGALDAKAAPRVLSELEHVVDAAGRLVEALAKAM